MSENNTRAPLPCPEMGKIREDIDSLDKDILQLLKKRLNLIEQAALVKPERNQVRDKARIDEVIALIKLEAREANYPEHMAEAIWKNIIELSIDYEYDAYDKKD
ncbi:MAG: chorismate mutase [PS1 clade bacterium]|uniref:chorismate mutase n=1 Tax=PS1 clade bacterium TaxID=2175152 RepID=A0A368DW03_9PROT|nr:MAG: chorismate mutase [PS1 clade bacterium]HCV49543.1 chorismate mutase [Rhodobiaceae bacterium]|tara:strand:- start:80 stop:391 length:312 start_codon:yes stop_codon:yes gene_type:complete